MEFPKLLLLTFLGINIKRFVPGNLWKDKLLLTGIWINRIKFILFSDWSEELINHPLFKSITNSFVLHHQGLKRHGLTVTKVWTFTQDNILIYSKTYEKLILNVVILIIQWELLTHDA